MIHRYVQRDQKKVYSKETLCSVIREPIVTEKSTLAKDKNYHYFFVASWANKIAIKKAVESVFSVSVEEVKTSILKGKTKRFKGTQGRRSDVKKAMVRLADGSHIDFEKEKASWH